MKRVFAYLLLTGGLLAPALGNNQEKKTIVVAPECLVQEWARQIAGETLAIRTTPAELSQGEQAALILKTGLESFSIKKNTTTPEIILSDGLPLLKKGQQLRPQTCKKLKGSETPKPCCCNSAKPSPHYEAVFSSSLIDAPVNPYAWMDVSLAMSMVISLTEALCDLTPEHAAVYKARSQAYLDKLEDLDKQLLKELKNSPHTSSKEPNASWRYFTRRYGLQPSGDQNAESFPRLTIGEHPYIETMKAYASSLKNKGPEA